jgi:5-methylcytosine-specific restriction endonuclease McrA
MSFRCNSLRGLSDTDLLTRLEKLCGTEREVQRNILIHLIEVDRRRLYLSMGYGSLFEFCTGYLKYSNSAAGRRIRAARCIGRFPRVADMFSTGEINLTAIAMISGILTRENAGEILDWVKGRPFRDVEMLVSRHRPERHLRDRVRPVCIMTENTESGIHPESAECMPGSGGKSTPAAAADTAGSTPAGAKTGFVNASPGLNNANAASGAKCKASLTFTPNIGSEKFPNFGNSNAEKKLERVEIKQKFQLQFAVDPEFMEMLDRIVSLLSTKYPTGITFEMIFTILMKEYLARHSPENRIKKRNEREKRRSGRKYESTKKRTGAEIELKNTDERRTAGSTRPGRAVTAASEPCRLKKDMKERRKAHRTRHIPQSVRDEVFARDGGRCTFVGDNGARCNSRWNLEIDHIVPFAKGGGNSPGNLRLLCARHNRLAAEREHGTEFMKSYHRRE